MEFNREENIQALSVNPEWDIIIIGGGATGLGAAVDASLRGYKVLLLEQADFAKGTSSRSTKLVHGGVRYLAQGDVALVYEALHERTLLFKNAPHLVREQKFIIPCYNYFDKLKYGIGLKLYDLLAGKSSLSPSKILNAAQVAAAIPGIITKGLKGGVQYSDGQFDDARLAVNLAQTAAQNGAVLSNYIKVTGLIKQNGLTKTVTATDLETGKVFQVNGKVIINATGVFVDDVLKMDNAVSKPIVQPSQGVHVVVNRDFIGGSTALMIPKTDDGRVLFAVPWHGKLLVGTTDTPLKNHQIEPVALQKEIDFILSTAAGYFKQPFTRADVLSVFAGLRPLAAPAKGTDSTKEISRSHKIIVSPSQLITITGGKWTTYRKMAEDVIDKAAQIAGLPSVNSKTTTTKIHGAGNISGISDDVFGTDRTLIQQLAVDEPALADELLNDYLYTKAEVVWAVRHEMARTVEDVLARRLRVLFLDANAALQMAPLVAELLAGELQHDTAWQAQQVEEFNSVAQNYALNKPA